MEAFGTWWEGLTPILKVFWSIAVPFTLFFILQLILSFFGAESPDDLPDAEIDADHGIPFQFLTLKNLIGFFTIFSWTGIACVEAGYSNGISLMISTIAGLLMMGLMAGLFYLMTKSGADGTMKIQNAIGQTGEVYLTIQANRKSLGKVQVKVSGAVRTLDAMTDDDETLTTGQLARVVQIINDNILLVTSK
ncbi:MAG: hypothetical protein KF856_12655 [Cyclobacteriaceae bacterium]|nr:hypothetical protein [Cyclobacteriaceae bacterium]